jgi:hypothetical protein
MISRGVWLPDQLGLGLNLKVRYRGLAKNTARIVTLLARRKRMQAVG